MTPSKDRGLPALGVLLCLGVVIACVPIASLLRPDGAFDAWGDWLFARWLVHAVVLLGGGGGCLLSWYARTPGQHDPVAARSGLVAAGLATCVSIESLLVVVLAPGS